jgi:hypothetical protein
MPHAPDPVVLRSLLLVVLVAVGPGSAIGQSPQQQVLERINAERWANGQLPPLKGQGNLDAAADGHSLAMGQRNFMMHCDPDTLTGPGARMIAAGYTGFNAPAENIAAGYGTAAAVVQGWMDSAWHRATILSTAVREVGTGYHLDPADQGTVRLNPSGGCAPETHGNGPYHHYWTQKFARRDSVLPVVIAREAWQVAACRVDIHLYGSGWASQYRLSNDGTAWGPWLPFAADVLWDLAGGAGSTATVHAQLRNGLGEERSAQDSVRLAVDCAAAADAIFGSGFQ